MGVQPQIDWDSCHPVSCDYPCGPLLAFLLKYCEKKTWRALRSGLGSQGHSYSSGAFQGTALASGLDAAALAVHELMLDCGVTESMVLHNWDHLDRHMVGPYLHRQDHVDHWEEASERCVRRVRYLSLIALVKTAASSSRWITTSPSSWPHIHIVLRVVRITAEVRIGQIGCH